MTAKFEADSAFLIRGRGLVLAGWVVEGRIKPGMTLSIPSFPQKLVVQGIELITLDPTAKVRPDIIGIRFSLFGEQESLLWRNLDVKGKIFEIDNGSL